MSSRRSSLFALLALGTALSLPGALPALAQVDASRAGPGAMPVYESPLPYRTAGGKYAYERRPEDVYAEGTGVPAIPARFDWAGMFMAGENTASVMAGGRWGRIDEAGRELVPIRFDYANDCVNGLAVVWMGGKAGAWDCKAQAMAIEPQFAYLGDFSQLGNAAAVRTNKWGLVDRSGRELAPFDHALVRPYASGWSSVVKAGEEYYLNPQGRRAYPFGSWFVSMAPGPVTVKNDKGLFALAGRDGREITPFDYTSLTCAEDLCVAAKGGKAGVLDGATGRVITPLQWDGISYQNGHFLAVQGGRTSYFDRAGKPLAGGQSFVEGRPFDPEGFAIVRQDKLWYLIDRNGRQITPKGLSGRDRIPDVRHTPTGLIVALVNDKAGAVDHAGNIVIPFQFEPAPLTDRQLNPLWSMANDLGPQPSPVWFRDPAGKEQAGLMGMDGRWLIAPGPYMYVGPAEWTRRSKNRTLAIVWGHDLKKGIYDVGTGREVVRPQFWKLASEDTWYRALYEDGHHGALRVSDWRLTHFSDAAIDDWAEPLDLFVIEKGDNWGVVDARGAARGAVVYDFVAYTDEPAVPFYAIDKAGNASLLDAQGRMILGGLQPVQKDTWNYDRGYVTMKRGGQLILVDARGQVVTTAAALGTPNARSLYVTRIGPLAVIAAGVAAKNDENEWSIILNGQVYSMVGGKPSMIPPEFQDGLLAVKKDGLFGYIDMYGKVAIPFQFEHARQFYQGRAEVRLNGQSRLIDLKGQPQAYADMGLVMFDNGFPKPAGAAGTATPAGPKPEPAWDQTIDPVTVRPEVVKTFGMLCYSEWWYKAQTEDPDSAANTLAELIVFKAAGVKNGEDEATTRRKIRSIWTAYEPYLSCGQKGSLSYHGSVLKAAVHDNNDGFRNSMLYQWRIPVNAVDPADGRTALDLLDDMEAGGRKMSGWRRSLIQRGAKNRKDLDGTDCRRGTQFRAKEGCPQE